MQIVTLILIGLLVGVVAKMLMPGRDPGGFVVTFLLGVAGSFLGALIASFLDFGTGWFTSFAMAVMGAMLLLGLYRFLLRAAMRAS